MQVIAFEEVFPSKFFILFQTECPQLSNFLMWLPENLLTTGWTIGVHIPTGIFFHQSRLLPPSSLLLSGQWRLVLTRGRCRATCG